MPARPAATRGPRSRRSRTPTSPAARARAGRARWRSRARRRPLRRRSRWAGPGRCRALLAAGAGRRGAGRRRLAHPAAADGRGLPPTVRRAVVLRRCSAAASTATPAAWCAPASGWLVARDALLACCGSSTRAGWGSATSGWPALLGLALGWLGWGQLLVGMYAGFLLGGLPGLLLALVRRDRALRARRTRSGRSCWSARWSGCSWGRWPLWCRSRRPGDAAGPQRIGDERLTPCCAGSPRASPTAPPWSRSSRGCPPTCTVTTDDIADALARRRLGYGRGARMKFEQDEVTILGGVRHGETMGGPVAIEIGNTEWPKWEKVMSADPVDPVELEALARNAAADPAAARATPTWSACRSTTSTRPGRSSSAPRPARPPPGSRSGRVAVALPRAGRRRPDRLPRRRARRRARARRLCARARRRRPPRRRPGALPRPRGERRDGRPRSTRPTRTATPSAASSRSSCTGCRPGLGSHVHWDRRLDSRLAGALMGIQAIKGVEVGDGFELAATPGSPGPRRDRARPTTASAASAAAPAAPRAA